MVRKNIKADKRSEMKSNIPRTELFEEIRNHDVFMMSMCRYTVNGAAVSVMAFGFAILAKSVFSIPEMVVDGENGVLRAGLNSRKRDDSVNTLTLAVFRRAVQQSSPSLRGTL